MNSIPLIFNERKIAYTIVGGGLKQSDEEYSQVTVVLLNRGGRYYRSAVFQNLEKAGFSSVISVELSAEPYDVENLSVRFPSVKFLIPQESVSVGDMINIAMAETFSPKVFVVWNDIRVSSISDRLVSKLPVEEAICVSPVLTSQRMEALPVQMVPALNRHSFQVEPMACYRDGCPTLYPFDFVGVYNRERFIKLGGYDHTLSNPYWQNLDFGFRSHLWGEKIIVSSSFRLGYDGEVPQEDISADASYTTFFLKNLMPVFRRDEAYIPISRFFSFCAKSPVGFFSSWALFRSARTWVRINRYRFIHDAETTVGQWEPVTHTSLPGTAQI